MNPDLQASIREALDSTQDDNTTDDTLNFDPVPDGYYARPDTTHEEVTAALSKAGIHLNRTH